MSNGSILFSVTVGSCFSNELFVPVSSSAKLSPPQAWPFWALIHQPQPSASGTPGRTRSRSRIDARPGTELSFGTCT